MTSVIELLELAAGTEEPSFDAGDLRRRVHRRRTARGVAAVLSSLVVLGGLVGGGLALANRDDSNRLEVSGSLAGEPADLVGRWTPVAYSAVVVPPDGAYIEFVADGTFRGDDGCNPFHGRWSVDDSRLVTDELESGARPCASDHDTELLDLLHDDPGIGESDIDAGALELRSGDRFVALERADGSVSDSTPSAQRANAGTDPRTVGRASIP
jgi:heat shock protein HslJ